jgi:hypothetical protein
MQDSSPMRKEEERMRSTEEDEEKRRERMTGWTKCWATRENKGRERGEAVGGVFLSRVVA